MAEKRLVDANELEEKAIYITGPKGSACHAVPLGLIQAAPQPWICQSTKFACWPMPFTKRQRERRAFLQRENLRESSSC